MQKRGDFTLKFIEYFSNLAMPLMIIIIICFLCNMNYYLLCIKKNGILLWNIEILRKVVYKKVNFGLLTFFLDIKLFYFKVF